jgi:16S rRNA (guanine(1405)-N(7))-methyltransferase
MKELLEQIKKKKELKDLDENFVENEIDAYFKINPQKKKLLEKPNSKKYKEIVKQIRAKLRRSFGLFRDDKNLRNKLLNEKNLNIKSILKTHSSTKERLEFYSSLYKKIFAITGLPKSILDLGCGINPYSIKYMNLNPKYFSFDLDKDEIKQINTFFRKKMIPGIAKVKNILVVKKFPIADLAFLFKMTDVIDRGKGHKKTEEIIKILIVKFVIVSFPTITMSGKRMRFPRRKWIELLCERLGYSFQLLEFTNEIFYVIKK